jgi:hypothetical protein
MAGIREISGRTKPKAKRRITPPVTNQDKWLLETLDSHLTSENTPPRPKVFHPSQVGQKCDRLLYLGYNGYLKGYTIVPKLARIFGCGSSLEDRVAKYFTDMGIMKDRELPVKYDDPPLSGRIDFIVEHGEHGMMPIELKSINNLGFGKLSSEPKPEHLIQLQLYMHLWGAFYGTVLYENKDNQDLKAFLVSYDERIITDIFDRCKRIMDMEECPTHCGGDRWCACKGVEIE